jgi:transcription factor TFIIIB component B''
MADIDDDAPLSLLIAKPASANGDDAAAAAAEPEPEAPPPIPYEQRTIVSILQDTKSGTPSRSALERARKKKNEREAKRRVDKEKAQKEKEKAERHKKRAEAAERGEVADIPDSDPEDDAAAAGGGASSGTGAGGAAAGPASAAARKPTGPQVRVVDGKLVLHEESLLMAAPESASNAADGVFASQRITTSASYTNRKKTDAWTTAETQLFFRCLAQYGTDFTFIAQMFPNKRTRAQVKAKFKREERDNQYLVDAALKKKMPIGQCSFGWRDPCEL